MPATVGPVHFGCLFVGDVLFHFESFSGKGGKAIARRKPLVLAVEMEPNFGFDRIRVPRGGDFDETFVTVNDGRNGLSGSGSGVEGRGHAIRKFKAAGGPFIDLAFRSNVSRRMSFDGFLARDHANK